MDIYSKIPLLHDTTLHAFIDAVNRETGNEYPLASRVYQEPISPEVFDNYQVSEHWDAFYMLREYHQYWKTYYTTLITDFFQLQDQQTGYQFSVVFPMGLTLKYEGFGDRQGNIQLQFLINALSEIYQWHNYQYGLLDTALSECFGVNFDRKGFIEYMTGKESGTENKADNS